METSSLARDESRRLVPRRGSRPVARSVSSIDPGVKRPGVSTLPLRCSALVVATSVFGLVIAWGRGNELALGPPLGLCLLVSLWPGRPGAVIRRGRSAARVVVGGALWGAAIAGIVQKANRHLVTDESVAERIARATAAYQDGQLHKALRLLESTEIPAYLPLRNAQRYHNLGVVLLRLGQPGSAYEALVASLRYDAANIEAYRLLARVEESRGRLEEAKRWRARMEERGVSDRGIPRARALK